MELGIKPSQVQDSEVRGSEFTVTLLWLTLGEQAHGSIAMSQYPNPGKPVVANHQSRFIGKLKIEDYKLDIFGCPSPRRRRYNPYEPEASLRPFYNRKNHFVNFIRYPIDNT